jgi:hypothetical protein
MTGKAFDRDDGYSGQEYAQDREAEEGKKLPTGTVAARPADALPPVKDLPPEAGRRAYFDPQTGEVHGSGAGAGGGNSGEDYDSDSAAGGGVLPTGRGGTQP